MARREGAKRPVDRREQQPARLAAAAAQAFTKAGTSGTCSTTSMRDHEVEAPPAAATPRPCSGR
jgi:hypothetical protein